MHDPHTCLDFVYVLAAFAAAVHGRDLTVRKIERTHNFSFPDHMNIHVPVLSLMTRSYGALPHPQDRAFERSYIFRKLHHSRLVTVAGIVLIHGYDARTTELFEECFAKLLNAH
jgi:hypothetical protein